MERSCGTIAGGGERSRVEGSCLGLRRAISGGGERSQVEESSLRWSSFHLLVGLQYSQILFSHF